jgi:hypothetical protein
MSVAAFLGPSVNEGRRRTSLPQTAFARGASGCIMPWFEV